MKKQALLLWALLALATPLVNGQTANAPVNQLTKAEQKAGWRLLFDGKTFNGWRGFLKDKVPDAWVIEDGCIKLDKDKRAAANTGGDLITLDEFENFELSLEWKISPGGNSGVKYLISEVSHEKGGAIGFEMQIIDDEKHPDATKGIGGNRKASALYDVMPANAKKKLQPVGEFNQVRIVVQGAHVEHWLNGEKVLEFERGSEAFRALIAKSKFHDKPLFGAFAKGHILLQEHKDAVWFRNIKIRELK